MTILTMSALENMTLKELYALAKQYKIAYYAKLTKKELIFAILKSRAEQEGFFFMEGVLEIIQSEGYGFLRPINYSPSSEDIYISASQIRRFDLRNGDKVTGKVRPPKESERYYGLLQVEAVNGEDPEVARERVHFPALTPLYPDRHIKLETESIKSINTNYGSCLTCWIWSAWTNCRSAKSRENIAFERNCQFHHNESSRCGTDCPI